MKACGCLFLRIVIQVSDGLLARFVKYYFIVIDEKEIVRCYTWFGTICAI